MVLQTGEALPPISAIDLDGKTVSLPEAAAGGWAVVLFYRGHW